MHLYIATNHDNREDQHEVGPVLRDDRVAEILYLNVLCSSYFDLQVREVNEQAVKDYIHDDVCPENELSLSLKKLTRDFFLAEENRSCDCQAKVLSCEKPVSECAKETTDSSIGKVELIPWLMKEESCSSLACICSCRHRLYVVHA